VISPISIKCWVNRIRGTNILFSNYIFVFRNLSLIDETVFTECKLFSTNSATDLYDNKVVFPHFESVIHNGRQENRHSADSSDANCSHNTVCDFCGIR
jgi:hypothetical protein